MNRIRHRLGLWAFNYGWANLGTRLILKAANNGHPPAQSVTRHPTWDAIDFGEQAAHQVLADDRYRDECRRTLANAFPEPEVER